MGTTKNKEIAMSWLQTFSGVKFDPLHPKKEDIRMLDIAHSLSMQCRFNGHVIRYYCVAEHSVTVSRILPEEYKLWGLLHDAPEAYVSDLIRPVKEVISGYADIEDHIMEMICDIYGLSWPMPHEVKRADDILLVTEKRDLLVPASGKWKIDEVPLEERIEPWTQEKAMIEFLRAMGEYGAKN